MKKSNNTLINKKNLCYLCGKNDLKPAFEKLNWSISCCDECGLYRLDFKGSYYKFIANYYNKAFFTGSDKRAGYFDYEGDKKAEKKNMQQYLRGILKYKKQGKLLDVGCATGLFMLEAQASNFDVYGIDVSEYALSIAKKRFGKKVQLGSVEESKLPHNEYDIVTLFDVIEHLADPRKVLIKVKDLLKDDGLVIINTGDTDSLLAKLQDKDWHFFIPPQ